MRGRLWVANSANHVVVRQLYLDGRNGARLPSPTVNGNRIVFRDNDITTRNTTICFVLGSDEYGRAVRTVIERNRIHNCGELPPTNHHHGIYAEATDGARITDNWIYDNADRGVQLFPDAQRTYVARNVIDGNGEGVVFARRSAHNVIEHNVIANSIVRYNVEDFELRGSGNVVRRNCLWSPFFGGNALISPGIGVEVSDNLVSEPGYLDRDRKDFRLSPAQPVLQLLAGARGDRGLARGAAWLQRRAGHPARQVGRKPRRDLGLGFQHVGSIVSQARTPPSTASAGARHHRHVEAVRPSPQGRRTVSPVRPAINGSTATASRPATRATALLIPDAMPEWRESAAARTVAVTGATTSVRPSPNTITAGSTLVDVAVARVDPRHQQQPGRDHERPDGQRDPGPDALRERARARREQPASTPSPAARRRRPRAASSPSRSAGTRRAGRRRRRAPRRRRT